MRIKIINYLKVHPEIVYLFYKFMKFLLSIWGLFLPIKQKTILFCSFGGRKFDDSPRALYDEICCRREFDDWQLTWAFANPSNYHLQRGNMVKIDTLAFFKALLTSKVWISNSGMDRGINLHRKGTIKIDTWHGTPLKKIGGEENQNSIGGNKTHRKKNIDKQTIRCAQSEYDQEIFSRIFYIDKEKILLSDLPRNDALFNYSKEECEKIKSKLGIKNKKVILYTPTYREYMIDKNNNTYIAPPIDLIKWKKVLGEEYILLIRTHYAVIKAMNIQESDFVINVSDYPTLNDLYIISDLMISDYSSTFIDFSILNRPMFCFAYDLEEYNVKRGLYIDLDKTLPCKIHKNEDDLLNDIKSMNKAECVKATQLFHERFAPNAGKASKFIVDVLLNELK